MTAAELRAMQAGQGTPTRAKRRDLEGPLHRSILHLLEMVLPPDAIYHHSPNELDMAGPEAARQVAKARKLGTKPGWLDIEIIWQGRAYFLEIKNPNGRLSDAQRELHPKLIRAGAAVAVVRSVTEAEATLKSWGLI